MTTLYEEPGRKNLVFVPSIRTTFGATRSLDLTFQTELESYGFGGKYSLLNSEADDGFSLALTASLFGLAEGTSYTVGGVASYLQNLRHEPYLIVRFNHARINPSNFDLKYFPEGSQSVFNFWLSTVGYKYWIRRDFALGAEFSLPLDRVTLPVDPSTFLVLQSSFLF